MTRLLIARHGETVDNALGLIHGSQGGELSELGRRQAERVCQRLHREEPTRIWCSDLARARATIAPLMDRLAERISFLPDLRERSMGVFEGAPGRLAVESVAKSGQEYWEYEPPGGESVVQVMARAKLFWETHLRGAPGSVVAVLSHGTFNRALLGTLLGLGPREVSALEQDNACVNILEQRGDRWIAIELNGRQHLS